MRITKLKINIKGKKIFVILLLPIIFFMVQFILCYCSVRIWRNSIISQMETIQLPENTVLVGNPTVILSDVYGVHIVGDAVLETEQKIETVEKYIKKHNTGKQLHNISIMPFSEEWDDWAIQPDTFFKKEEKNHNNTYISIHYYKSLQILDFLSKD